MTDVNPPGGEQAAEGYEDPVADGGETPANPLDVLGRSEAPDRTVTRREWLWTVFRRYVYAPWLVMRHDWRALVGIGILSTYVLVGLFGPLVIEPTEMGDGPNSLAWFETMAYPLGTDQYGNDLLAQTVYSVRPILTMMIAGGVWTIVLGTVFGTVAGYVGGNVDKALSTVIDVFINIPGLPLVIVLAAIFQPQSAILLGVLLTIEYWASLARAIRSQVLQIRYDEYAEASRILGLSTGTVLRKDVIPKVMPYISVQFVSAMRTVLFSAVGLYFIGVLPFGNTNWGIMMSNAYDAGALYRPRLYHWIIVPSVAIIVLSIGMILLVQSLDRVFNPRVRERHRDRSGEEPPEEEDDGARTKGVTIS